eukprot:7786936-Alexandrium_andersonii.AAC.1
MEEHMGVATQAIDSAKRDADNARKSEEQLRRELVEVKQRELQPHMAAESKAYGKLWYPVGSDVGLATVSAVTATMP